MRIRFPVSRPSLGPAERAAVVRALRSGWVTQGPAVARFEAQLAETLRVAHVVACATGTAALHLALATCRIGPGDEVLVPDLTYVATANAVRYTGATPVLVDVDAFTWNLVGGDAARKRTPRTRAILPVHLYGVPADMDAVTAFANTHQLIVLEDAAQALGATLHARPCGTFGVCGTFSFFGNKVLTTGEGGAVATNDGVLAKRLRLLRGQAVSPLGRYRHTEVGFNYRLTDLQGALGAAQLARLPRLLRERRRVAAAYGEAFAHHHLDLEQQTIGPAAVAAPWLTTVLFPAAVKRDALAAQLAHEGIDTRPTFVPLHRLPMYAARDAQFPVSSAIGDCGLSLPTYPDLATPDVHAIVRRLARAVTRQHREAA